jgi:hypothetical protein
MIPFQMNENESSSGVKLTSVVGNVTTSVEDENSNDLPLTIKIEAPYIRDIDEDDGSDSPKGTSLVRAFQ